MNITSKSIIRFFIGFFAWYILASIFWLPVIFIQDRMGPEAMVFLACFCVPLPATLISGVLLLLRKQFSAAFGLAGAFGINLILLAFIYGIEDFVVGLMVGLAGTPFFLKLLPIPAIINFLP